MKGTITLKKMTVAWGLNIAGPILTGVITELRISILTIVCKKVLILVKLTLVKTEHLCIFLSREKYFLS